MATRKIVTYEDPRLRKRSIRIKRIDRTIQSLIDDMIETMREANGVGLAAPQIGILLRLIVAEFIDDETEELHQQVLINPEIVEKQGEWMAEEGCLSIPGFVGTVPRAETVTVRGQDRGGKRIKINADGYLAHILQHEIDHLEGVLYVDYLEKGFDDLQPVEPGEKRRRRRAGLGQDGERDEEQVLNLDTANASEPPAANDGDPSAPAPLGAGGSGDSPLTKIEESAEAQPTTANPAVDSAARASSAKPGLSTSAAHASEATVTACFDPCCGRTPATVREPASLLGLQT